MKKRSSKEKQSTSSKSIQIEVLAALVGEELEPMHRPCIDVDDEQRVMGVGRGCSPSRRVLSGLVILPALCNAHLHILDVSIAEAGETLPLHDLVALPTGLKYRLLPQLSSDELARRVATAAARMKRRGVLYAGVYAELGRKGLQLVSDGMVRAGVAARILGQPLAKNLSEYLQLLDEAKGVGLDTVFDLNPRELNKLVAHARHIGGHVHVHVSETLELYQSRDYEVVLRAAPTAAIHLTYLGKDELIELAESGIGLVYCPRSNMYHLGRLPPLSLLPELLEKTLVGIGTDNAAWIPPYIDEEIMFAYMAVHRDNRDKAEALARALLKAATISCTKLLRLDGAVVGEGVPVDRLLAAEIPEIGWSSSPIVSIVKRLSAAPRSSLQAFLAAR